MLDPVLLSRAQFGFTIGFHILFPTLTVGLALFLAIMEGVWLKTRNPMYLSLCQFWAKIFALTFGMGVVSGLVLSYELGTNFGAFTNAIGSVLGSLFEYEVLSAFFLEAGFLGIMLFGWGRVPPKLHYMATLLVALGTTLSVFWILSANSWMQTPAGFHIENGKYLVDSWSQVVFNPSFLPRFTHMLLASYTTVCFFIAGVSAWYLIKNRHVEMAKRCFSYTMGAALIVVILQVGLGDLVGLKIHEYQPLKTAAIEGVWDTRADAPFVIFGLPDPKQETNHYAINIPYGASFINTHHFHGSLIGLKTVPPQERPLVTQVFFSFRVMLFIGFFFLAMALYALWLRTKGLLFAKQWFLKLCIYTTPLGFISTVAGWLTAEWGRQPWAVYGFMRTQDAASSLTGHQVFISLILFFLVYGIVFSFYLTYLLKLIRKGPASIAEEKPIDRPPFSYLEASQEKA